MITKWMLGKQGIAVKTVAVLLLFLAFLLPPTLLYFKLVSLGHLVPILGGIPTLSLLVYIVLYRPSFKRLGFNLNLQSVLHILPMTLAILLGELLLFALVPWLLGRERPLYLDIPNIYRYTYVTIFQEIVWRGFAFILLEKTGCKRRSLVILTSAFLFSFAHIYYRNTSILVGSFLLGLFWGRSYFQDRSLTGPIISHYILGVPIIVLNYMGIKMDWRLL
ncbi:MAG: CPBP family intramembrane metalloprotease [Leptolyngbyaceae cyanobacterium MAG.088]|nr:CPBP family intramembrane metalloprotease [Leptolyngbyaceae cyanobacterium MAG.088]